MGKKNKAKSKKEPKHKPAGKQRLQKVLASAGVESRRKCEEMILDGEVRVNRKVIEELPAFVDPENDVITVRGRRIQPAEKVYYLLNKPKGVICTNFDPQGRKKAIDLIDCRERIFCVGRLDADTTGAIILTNDSELSNRLTHPRYELDKTYEVKLKGRIEGASLEKLKKGTWLSEGKTSRAGVKVLKRSYEESVVQIIIRQGLNRQVRRMMARVGYKVKSLRRVRIGNIGLKGLGIGGFRKLSTGQVKYLKRITGMK
jgi:23S rRNA pseudouridine2605 synthase